ncbi:uncharacterized protein [Montipora foliosa]|uniref:uncharacterized protein n=1 Tax=Montipora foliosa TaxID=591990 RepID=UPI0035F20123
MAYFNPSRPIVVRAEASYHESSRWSPSRPFHQAHYDPNREEIEPNRKGCSCHPLGKNRFSIYLLGAPRSKIITARKPVLPLFNKARIKLPPRIEKWVTGMQDVDFELLYEAGKDEADPLDFLSRHPLQMTGNDAIEKVIKHVITPEHAIVMDNIREETLKDHKLQNLAARIQMGDWNKHRRDPDISCFYEARHEFFVVDDLILRINKIVIPTSFQRKVIKAAHHLGHLGMTKTKQMLREKYWLVEQIMGGCILWGCRVVVPEYCKTLTGFVKHGFVKG